MCRPSAARTTSLAGELTGAKAFPGLTGMARSFRIPPDTGRTCTGPFSDRQLA